MINLAVKAPFHQKDYGVHKGIKGVCPLLEILVGATGKPIIAYADTGCTGGLALLKTQIKNLQLGEKISEDPYKISVADGHQVGADIYKSTVSLNGVQQEVVIWVINPDNFWDNTEENKEPVFLLGRDFLDHFDVMFKGKDKRIEFFHP